MWKWFGCGNAIFRMAFRQCYINSSAWQSKLQFLTCAYILSRWLTNAHEFAALAYIAFTVNVQAIGAARVRNVQHIQETPNLFCPLHICPKSASSRPLAWSRGDTTCIAYWVLHSWLCLGTTNYSAEFPDSSWKRFLIRKKRQVQKNQHVWQPQLYQELPFSTLKIGTACTVHIFQCGSVLNGHE